MSALHTSVKELAQTANQFWQEYLRVGPGVLNSDALQPFTEKLAKATELAAADQTSLPEDWQIRFEKIIGDLEPLLRRCAERTEGLSFVTGEAGLIPRKDQHALCETSIAMIRELADELSQ